MATTNNKYHINLFFLPLLFCHCYVLLKLKDEEYKKQNLHFVQSGVAWSNIFHNCLPLLTTLSLISLAFEFMFFLCCSSGKSKMYQCSNIMYLKIEQQYKK